MQTMLSEKGEVLIPAHLLDRYGLKAGATVLLEPREGEIALRPIEEPVPRARLVEGTNGTLLL